MMQAMKLLTTTMAAAALMFAVAAGAFAQSEHEGHHPGGQTPPATPAPQAQPESTAPMQKEGMGMMGGKDMPMMKMMQEMHGKMMGGGMATPDSQWHMMRGVGPMSGLMSGDCPMTGGMMQGEDMPSFAEGRIAFLKAELAISDTQKGVWDTYADALRANFQGMHEMRQTMKGRTSAMTPVERLEMHLTAVEARVKALQVIKPPLAALYAALAPDQKKRADELLTSMGCMM
jgi:hypothetical protein